VSLKRRILCGILGIHIYRGWLASQYKDQRFLTVFRKCVHCEDVKWISATLYQEGDRG
jgi:hypothetical protein